MSPSEAILSSSTRVSCAAGVLVTSFQGVTVMLEMNRGKYYGLDDIGQAIWGRLSEPCTVGDLCARLAIDYEVDASTCRRDVLRLLEQLLAEGLLQVHGSEGEQG